MKEINMDLIDLRTYAKAEERASQINYQEKIKAQEWNEKNRGGMFYKTPAFVTARDVLERDL